MALAFLHWLHGLLQTVNEPILTPWSSDPTLPAVVEVTVRGHVFRITVVEVEA